MKKSIAALFLLVFLIPIHDAAARGWCASNFGDQPDPNCAPMPFQYCLSAMAASPFAASAPATTAVSRRPPRRRPGHPRSAPESTAGTARTPG